jgi:2-polyprenyl-6-methoxyphenol hydroxylase-like FAD-dependent oxidoreductase
MAVRAPGAGRGLISVIRPILIAGGGIGGLTLALMLHRRGLPCLVFEAAKSIRPLGVGINALPHAIRELAALDLLPRLDRIGIRTRSLTYANHLGQAIWSEPRGIHAGHDVPQFSLHRGRFHTMLWDTATERLGAAALLTDRRLLDYAPDSSGVVARFQRADGTIEAVEGAALIGADGIHSTLRAALHPDDGGIRWNGIAMWRGATEWPAFDGGDTQIIAGDAVAKLVIYPIAPGATVETRLTNWVIYARTAQPGATPPARESWARTGAIADFRHFAERLHLPFVDVPALLQATEEIFAYPMCDRDPLPWWTRGRVTLLGDAAHPMYPVGSNGAAQAILDARCLTDCLAAEPVDAALAGYDAIRRPATAEIVRSNRSGGPERVIDLIASRAPGGFAQIDEVATPAELAGIVRGYAQLAGFEVKR